MTDKAKRTPKNAEGPFFVRAAECFACRLPEGHAPDLMEYDKENGSCYFKRQPVTLEETKRAVYALCVSCVGAVDYDGNNPLILNIRDAYQNSTADTDWRGITKLIDDIRLEPDMASTSGE